MFKLRNPFKRKIDYNEFISTAVEAVFSNVPRGYIVENLKISLDPEYEYSSVDYNLIKKDLVKEN